MKSTIAAVIQARTGSTRLPGKVLRPLGGVPMIEHIITRALQVRSFDRVVLAVPDAPSEDGLVALARRMGVDAVKGPEEDVLQRFILAGEAVRADHIMRICSDSPLIDIELMESLARAHLEQNGDHTIPDPAIEIPRGTGTEMVRFAALRRIGDIAGKKPYREHVTTYFYDHPGEYSTIKVPPPPYIAGKTFRLTVDTAEDFMLLEKIYALFYISLSPVVDLKKVISYLEAHPEIACLNSAIVQKDWRREM